MKVLHVINSLAAGGAEKLVSELTTALSHDCEVSLFTFQNSHDIFQENLEGKVEFHSFDEDGFFRRNKIKALAKLMKEHDIVHAHLFPTFYIVAFLSFFYTVKKLIYTEHNTHNKRRRWFFWLLEKWIYSRYDTVVCISQGVKKSLKEWIGTSVKTQIIANFVNIEKIASTNKEGELMPDLSTKIPLVMVGSFSEQKDQKTVVKALSVLPENYVLYFIGDGPKRELVNELVKKLNVTNRVFFLGVQNDVFSILKNCKYGILSSHWEGFGIVALEYMACGLLTLGTDVSGLNEVIPIKENLFTVGDYKQLTNRIIQIETDKTVEKNIILEQKMVLPNFDIAISAKKHLEIYLSNTKKANL